MTDAKTMYSTLRGEIVPGAIQALRRLEQDRLQVPGSPGRGVRAADLPRSEGSARP